MENKEIDLIAEKVIEKLQNEEVNLNYIKLTKTAKEPTQEHEGDLYDIYADEDVLIMHHESKLVSTGLAFSIPKGYQIRMYNRSGNPIKYSLVLSNGLGIIDTKYRGELKAQFFTLNGQYKIKKGDKIAQIELVPIKKIKFNLVEKLDETDRGSNGFGSSGK